MGETEGNRLRETAPNERPQERLQRLGAGALSDAELLALVLRQGTQERDVLSLAHLTLHELGGLRALVTGGYHEFVQLHGIGPAKAALLASVAELARRLALPLAEAQPLLDHPERVKSFLAPWAEGLSVEKFWVLCLNRKNRLLRRVEVTSGIATSSLAHPREVFRAAVREGAVSIVCAHNHPSGDPAPSAADVSVTRQLREASRALDIALLDHVILGLPAHDPLGLGFYSFKQSGLL